MAIKRETELDRYSAPSGLASAIGETAALYGIDIVPICAALDIDPATFSDLTGRISLDRLCRLLETCALIANDDMFGLKATEHFRSGSTGPYGYGLMAAPTALDFLRFLGEHQQYVSSKSYIKFTINEFSAEVEFSYSPLILKRNQYVDMGMALILQRLRTILGSRTDFIEVGMERPKPKSQALYREKISRKVNFDRRVNSIKLPAELFSVRNPNGDPRLFRLMDLQCRSLRPPPQKEADFTEELREFILSRISESVISLSEAAEFFRVSERTLQRRLADAGTSLNDTRDEVRRGLAEKLLAETDLSAAEIALRLGYSAPSAFTRSTLRWFGKTPRDVRKAAV
ncbi:AraC family transcriptional regulator ligand-binding domain-containing protein [Rhizobium sp. KVB221]|uniref:AraC family transcriptional regulator ligand-binding domain-containing protein n=2 Tax=Rhizobium setariae TaxID=2801340 RepID=A0A936YQ15_9HYPH|nr:AraC family transcriptional regulator ligand-binding domain-containing protein [Rhizobium setariae]